jgi:hypothetical protein
MPTSHLGLPEAFDELIKELTQLESVRDRVPTQFGRWDIKPGQSHVSLLSLKFLLTSNLKMSDGSDHRPPAYHPHAETSPSSEAAIPSVHIPRHTSIDRTAAQSSPPEASKDLPPSRPPPRDQFTIIDTEDSLKVDEEAANDSFTPIPRWSWRSKKKFAFWLMVALLAIVLGALLIEL